MKTIRIIISLLAICQFTASADANSNVRPPKGSQDEVRFEVREINNSTSTQYSVLKNRETELLALININNSERASASRSKTRKLDKELVELNDELSSTRRIMASYPKSVTDPGYSAPVKESYTPQPQVEVAQSAVINDALCYRVLFAISENPIAKNSLEGLTNILQQTTPSGQIIYYQGFYATKAEAEKACAKIKECTTFSDAFIVAMRGTERVAL